MTTIAHTAVGGVAGSLGLGSSLSFLLGTASHLPLDLIPHWDLKKIWIDAIITIAALAGLLVLYGPSPVFWGAVGGALPDLEHLFPLSRKYFPGHGKRHGRSLGRGNAVLQTVLSVVCFLVVVRLAS